jgi:hypothetical protein
VSSFKSRYRTSRRGVLLWLSADSWAEHNMQIWLRNVTSRTFVWHTWYWRQSKLD